MLWNRIALILKLRAKPCAQREAVTSSGRHEPTPKPVRFALAQLLCRPLPPLLAQRMRVLVYPYSLAMRDNYSFVGRAQTGSCLRATTRDFHGYPFSIHGYYDWRNVAVARAVTSPGDVIVEVGANIGTETVAYADLVGAKGLVHAIEPLPRNVAALERLAAGAPFRNSTVVVYPMALSDRNQRGTFVVPPEHASGLGHLLRQTRKVNPETVEVDCATLDSLEVRIGAARMLVLDTEGEEVKVLRGGRGYIRKHLPIIVLEAAPQHLEKAGNSIGELAEELMTLGYRPYSVRFGLQEVRSATNIQKTSNWVCIHRREEQLIGRIRRYVWVCGLMPCVPRLNPLTAASRR